MSATTMKKSPDSRERALGFGLGLLSSATFGLIPLFTLPLLEAGVSAQTALVYRFAIASAIMWPILRVRGEKFAIGAWDVLKIMLLSSMYLMAVLFFFHAFSFMSSGAVATIQFLYPVMVMLIMTVFFRERFYWRSGVAVLLAVAGVYFLSSGPGLEPALDPGAVGTPEMPFGSALFWGVALSLLAGLGNALYFVGIQVARLTNVSGLMMTFYVMVFGAIFCFVNAMATDSLRWIGGWREIGLAFLLAVVTAVISNLALIMAIKRVGSTISSILGVLEPLTAVCVGILVFGEPFTQRLVWGLLLIVFSVMLVLLGSGAPDKDK